MHNNNIYFIKQLNIRTSRKYMCIIWYKPLTLSHAPHIHCSYIDIVYFVNIFSGLLSILRSTFFLWKFRPKQHWEAHTTTSMGNVRGFRISVGFQYIWRAEQKYFKVEKVRHNCLCNCNFGTIAAGWEYNSCHPFW